MKDEALINAVIEQILIDVQNHDLTAIEELLRSAPAESLQAFLSDNPKSLQWSIQGSV
jgi:hypothetical protein